MRLQPELPPDPTDRGLVQADLGSHRPGRPLRGAVVGGGLQRRHDHLLDDLIGHLARLTRSRLVHQPVHSLRGEPGSPLAHRDRIAPQPLRDRLVRRAIRCGEHDPTPQRQRLLRLATSSPPLERLALVIAQHDLSRRPATLSHQCLPSLSTTTTTRHTQRKFPRTNDS